ncbi:MAG: TrkA family potassium uptake protein [Candidatus Eremiobacteraeota bacterium]|nr:TrkA family potassium uptake protein [Candidatus Eremiobacteraeota bacterium]
MNAIILGCGRIGALLARKMEDEGINVVIIDGNPDLLSNLKDFKGKAILGNGVDIDVLRAAKIEDADIFAAVTNRENTNLMAAQIAKGIFGVKRVACIVHDPRRASIYSDLGLDTVCITTVGANLIANSLMESKTVKKYQLGDGSGVALEIKIGKELDGKKITDLELEGGFKIASVIRGLKVIIPDNDFTLKADDHIFGVVLTDRIIDLEKKVGIKIKNRKELKGEISTIGGAE